MALWQFYWALMLLFDKICGKVIVGNLSGEELVGNILPASRFIPQCLLEAWKVQVYFSFIYLSTFIRIYHAMPPGSLPGSGFLFLYQHCQRNYNLSLMPSELNKTILNVNDKQLQPIFFSRWTSTKLRRLPGLPSTPTRWTLPDNSDPKYSWQW